MKSDLGKQIYAFCDFSSMMLKRKNKIISFQVFLGQEKLL